MNDLGLCVFVAVMFVIVPLVLCAAVLAWFRRMMSEGPTSSTPVLHPIIEPDPQAKVLDEYRSRAFLYPGGREVFLPVPTHPAPVYQIRLSGILQRLEYRDFADAMYRTDTFGNFTWAVDWLRVNNHKLSAFTLEIVKFDRLAHTYTILIDDFGERLTLAIDPGSTWTGSLTAEVTVLPAGTERVAVRRKPKVIPERYRTASLAAEKFAAQIEALTIRAQTMSNWEDPAFREKFARVHGAELIQHQAEIRKEATTFLEQHDVLVYLTRHSPAVVARFLGRLETVFLAERYALDKALAAVERPKAAAIAPAPARKRLTTEEVRAIKIRRQQVQDHDKLELKLDKIETRLQIRERLDKMPLDPDEREMLEQEIIREIEEGDDDGNTKNL